MSDVFTPVERCQALLHRFYKLDFLLKKRVDSLAKDIFRIPSGTLSEIS